MITYIHYIQVPVPLTMCKGWLRIEYLLCNFSPSSSLIKVVLQVHQEETIHDKCCSRFFQYTIGKRITNHSTSNQRKIGWWLPVTCKGNRIHNRENISLPCINRYVCLFQFQDWLGGILRSYLACFLYCLDYCGWSCSCWYIKLKGRGGERDDSLGYQKVSF